MTKTENNQIKELFDNAVAVAFENTDIQRTIYDNIQKTITTAVANAVDCYEIRRAVAQKIKDASPMSTPRFLICLRSNCHDQNPQ